MTNSRTLAIITQEHEDALADIALAQRLKTAPDRLKRLAAELANATEQYEQQEAAKMKEVEDMHLAAQEAQFAGLSDLSITEVKDAKSDSVLSSGFHIRWTRSAWNSAANASLPEPASVWGFTALDARVLTWIVQRHPDKLPASIMALAPGNVREALDRYFIGLRRGFLAS